MENPIESVILTNINVITPHVAAKAWSWHHTQTKGIPLNNHAQLVRFTLTSGQKCPIAHTCRRRRTRDQTPSYLYCPGNYIDALSATKNWAVERQRNAIWHFLFPSNTFVYSLKIDCSCKKKTYYVVNPSRAGHIWPRPNAKTNGVRWSFVNGTCFFIPCVLSGANRKRSGWWLIAGGESEQTVTIEKIDARGDRLLPLLRVKPSRKRSWSSIDTDTTNVTTPG